MDRGFPIVGIGASAGGLPAFEEFFRALPVTAEIGMAFVLVQHLAPDHTSILSELIQRFTTMPVFEITDGITVQRNSIYVIPPNRDLALINGTLQLLDPVEARGQRLAIDFFFRSLAQDQHDRAIGIVLSGSGSDGCLGVRAIKGEGGMVMAQTPTTTDFDSMPRSAIATGMVDFVLPPREMPAELMAYCGQAYGRAATTATTTAITTATAATLSTTEVMQKIFVLLRAQTGHDFSLYKPNTISRRVERRQAVHRIQQVDDYVRLLQRDPGEVDALFQDLLIGVTRFFRDPDAFAVLEAQAIPKLFANRSPGATVRVWVPGCSTGEEAYSIAMLLIEYMDAAKHNVKLQVFATDIDRRAIHAARSGAYPASISVDLTPERLARFFVLEENLNHFCVQKRVRDVVIFSEQDVTRDPPFSKLDLISCRNLMIYMGVELQKKLLPLFDYALRPGGYLFLGTSETVGDFAPLFSAVDRKAKVYQSRDDGHVRFAGAARFRPPPLTSGGSSASRRTTPPAKNRLRDVMARAILQHHAMAGAIVAGNGDILYLHGRTGQYLELPEGELHTNLVAEAREGLKRPLGAALRRAVARNQRVQQSGLSVRTNGDFTVIDLIVQPVPSGRHGVEEPVMFLVILEPAALPRPGARAPESTADAAESGTSADSRIEVLTHELKLKEASLLISDEELEASIEELQSTTEEMETSKEELQSVNEELSTVNVELQDRVADLSQLNNDMNNLLAGTGVGTIFVGYGLQITRFTPPVTQLINLIPTDVGRPMGHIVSNLKGYDRLVEDVQRVLDTLVPFEVEVQSKAGRWFLLHIRPYRTLENVIEGAVITFTDVTEMKQAQDESRALARLAIVLRDANDAIAVYDLDGRILAWNPGATRLYGWSEPEALRMNVRELIPEALRESALASVRQLSHAEILVPYRTQRLTKDGRTIDISLTATMLLSGSGEMYAIATTERAIT
ncbi:MAG: chemotaxis protein CheB [Gemmatimonadota bacterium]|nr:chemotaxis protein CheB [Gemmatimonadota bacterium]